MFFALPETSCQETFLGIYLEDAKYDFRLGPEGEDTHVAAYERIIGQPQLLEGQFLISGFA